MILCRTNLPYKKIIWLFLLTFFLLSKLVFAGQYIGIRDDKSGLDLINISNPNQSLIVRIAFVVPLDKPGYVGVCNPYGLPLNKEVPPPEAASSEFDKQLLPGQKLWVPNTACGEYVGYSIWVRNASGQLLEEIHK